MVHQRKTTQRNNRKFRTTRKNHGQKDRLVAGLIFANWCGHCQSLKPQWDEMKKSLTKNPEFNKKGGIVIEIEDSDPQKDSKIENINKTVKGNKLQANGYPTIFKKRGGTIEYYQGGRTAEEMRGWFLGGSSISGQIVGGYRLSKSTRHSRRSK
jgi:thiol-disulfide isomerase/thioredoxin